MNPNRFRSPAVRGLARGAAAVLAALALPACDLDLTNPNAPSEEQVVTTSEGVITLAVGLQSQYADNVNAFVRAPALVTDEWGTRPIALAADVSLVTGTVDPSFGVVSEQFTAAYRIARTANILQQSAPNVGLGKGLQTGIVSLSKLFKAMALGNLVQQYERLPADADPAALPLPRAEVLDTVITLLESARADLATVTDAELSGFNSRVLGTGFSLRNTVDAMLARYYLMDGRYQQAADAAGRVNRGVLSVLPYPNPGINPIYNYSVVSRYTGTRRSFFTEAEPADQRPNFWANRAAGVAGVPDSVFDFRQYGGRNDPFPVYLPDEMRLIQAEAFAQLGQLAAARDLVNAVRTSPASVPGDPVAGLAVLPAEALDTKEEILAQVLYERRYELYAQGLRWEDLRRLAAYTAKRPSIAFLPYPQGECDRNPARPCGG